MDSSIVITPMEARYVAQVLELWEQTEGLILTPTDNERDLEVYFKRNPGMSHVALNEGHVVGAVLCGHDGRRGYLHHLAVQTNFRNRGIGHRLVEHCLSALGRCGITQCNLFVVDDHQAGRQFWTAEGWNEWPDIRLMSKSLGS